VKPVDLRKIAGKSDILLVGDRHDDNRIKAFLQNQLAPLKDMGFSYFAMEMLTSDYQKDLDFWIKQRKTNKTTPRSFPALCQDVVDGYMRLIREAKAAGLTVIAMNHPDVMLFMGNPSHRGGLYTPIGQIEYAIPRLETRTQKS